MKRPKFNERKATQVAARFLAHAGETMPYMSLLKLMYFADRTALLRWGAPITNDSYYSLDHGPILSNVKNLMLEKGRRAGFWSKHVSSPSKYSVSLLRAAGNDELSRAEERLIDEIYSENKGLTQWQLSKKTHELPEWKDPDGSAIPIDLEDILEAGGVSEDDRESIVRDLRGLRKMQALSAQ